MSVEEQLARIENAQLVRRLDEPEVAYLFKHALTQDSAYESLLLKKRREIHRRVAVAYEQIYGAQLDPYAAILAQHYHQAGDDERTFYYALMAGDAAARIYAQAEALIEYNLALEVAERVDSTSEQLTELYLKRGRTLELSNRHTEALANYEAMETHARQRKDREMELGALVARATLHSITSSVYDAERAQALATQALAMARELGDHAAEAKILWNLMLLNYNLSRAAEAAHYGEQSLMRAREFNLREQMAYTLNDLARVYLGLAKNQEARAALEESRALWRAFENRAMLADNHFTAATMLFLGGDFDHAKAEIEEALRISQAIDNSWGIAYSEMVIGYMSLERGDYGASLRAFEECARRGEAIRSWYALIEGHAMKGLIYGRLGQVQRGFEHCQRALREAEQQFPPLTGYTLALLADLEFRAGNFSAAEAKLKESLSGANTEKDAGPEPFFALVIEAEFELARKEYARVIAITDELTRLLRRAGVQIFVGAGLYLKGKALLALGRPDEAQEILLQARAAAEALPEREALWRISFTLGEIESLRGDESKETEFRAEAREVLQYIVDHAPAELRESFVNLPEVRVVFDVGIE